MKHPEFKFVDVAIGCTGNRNNVMTVDQARQKIKSATNEVYCTYQRYPKDFLLHFKKEIRNPDNLDEIIKPTNSVSLYSGPSYSDIIPFDFDDENKPENALESVRNFIRFLEVNFNLPLSIIKIFFSGYKGFHVTLPIDIFGDVEPSPKFNLICKKIASHLWDVDYSIYDKTRLFRVPNTINSKSGLYKIPLEPSELLYKSFSEIKELAKKPRVLECAE